MRMPQDECDAARAEPGVADVTIEPDGTIVLRFHRRLRLTVDQTREVARAHMALAGGVKRPVLADTRGLISADRGSRELGAGAGVCAATARMAILAGSPVSRLLGSFFLRVATPAYPARIFDDESEARAWLKEHGP
jgi:hypothetical protein